MGSDVTNEELMKFMWKTLNSGQVGVAGGWGYQWVVLKGERIASKSEQ